MVYCPMLSQEKDWRDNDYILNLEFKDDKIAPYVGFTYDMTRNSHHKVGQISVTHIFNPYPSYCCQ